MTQVSGSGPAALPRGSLVISSWSTVSPFGIGSVSFAEGVRARRTTVQPIDPGRWQVPDSHACLVPDFDPSAVLDGKKTRAMDRVTGLAVAAVGELMNSTQPDDGRASTAIVLGTSNGSTQSMMDLTRASLLGKQPFYIEPATIPNNVMNCAASRCAICFKVSGPNVTVAAGRAAGLFALRYARRLLLTRRAARVLCGGAEEFSNARSWLDFHARGDGRPAVLGEGCAIFDMEYASPGATGSGLAEILAVSFRVSTDGDIAGALTECVQAALQRASVSAADAWAVCTSAAPGVPGRIEAEVAAALFGVDALGRVASVSLLGDAAAASVPFQIAMLMAAAEGRPEAKGRLAAVTSVDQDGTVGCALLRLAGGKP